MIKNLLLVLFITILFFSCGKKGDPEYKNSQNYKNINKIVS